MPRIPHRDPTRPGFWSPGDRTSIVIAEHDKGFVAQLGSECAFGGAVETVAIDQTEYRHG
jgi:hypothetical protein